MTPQRIQRKRSKGWKMPENTVYVGRPTDWVNMFRVGEFAKIGKGRGTPGFSYLCCWESKYADETYTEIKSTQQAVEMYREYLRRYPAINIAELRGKNLACWCPLDQPCHADVLLELANQPEP